MGYAEEAEEFAAHLRRLKERSGRSYGQLAQRAHLSTSTLHRYCHGKALPVEYAPVERLARLCGATREELLQLHRRWVRADALRGSAPPSAAASAAPSAPAASAAPAVPSAGDGPGPASAPAAEAAPAGAAATAVPEPLAESGTAHDAAAEAGATREGAAPTEIAHGGGGAVARRWWPVAALAALAVTVATGVLLAQERPGSGGRVPVAAASSRTEARTTGPEKPGPAAASASPSGSASAAAKGTTGPGAGGRSGAAPRTSSGPDAKGNGKAPSGGGEATGSPLSWTVRSHEWRHGCDHRYLIDRRPSRVPPPPVEQDARGWATALGAVHGGETVVEATVRAAAGAPVVVEGVYVRVVERRAPLARPVYEMSNGCGGALTPAVFAVDLDAARPVARPQDGYDGEDGTHLPAVRLPYQVSAGDPLVLRVEARTAECDCDWLLEVRWSSEGRSGMLRIDDGGKPFRTSGTGRGTAYGYDWTAGAWRPGA